MEEQRDESDEDDASDEDEVKSSGMSTPAILVSGLTVIIALGAAVAYFVLQNTPREGVVGGPPGSLGAKDEAKAPLGADPCDPNGPPSLFAHVSHADVRARDAELGQRGLQP